MKQGLQIKQAQSLALTPQLQQAIRLLQLSSLDLESEIEQLLLENPLLERVEPNEHNTSERIDFSNANISPRSTDDEAFDPTLNVACSISLREYLLAQVGEISLPSRKKSIVILLIEELDDKGYLSCQLEEIADNLPLDLQVEVEELAAGLAVLQQFNPTGVGARNLTESLLLQLNQLSDSANKILAKHIISNHLELLGQRDFARLKKHTGADQQSLQDAQNLIASLNPYPSSGFCTGETHYVIPDILVSKQNGLWQASINDLSIPKLKINSLYAKAIDEQKNNSGELPIFLQNAKWLIKSLAQRFDTILKVAEAIVNEQQAFFEQGEIAMRSMILSDIANKLELHESTVSRVTAQKYMLCPRGLLELKYFFSSHIESKNGKEISPTAIKAQIKKIIENETPKCPFSDATIANLLENEGIKIARRTVAKYREALHIPSANKRKIQR